MTNKNSFKIVETEGYLEIQILSSGGRVKNAQRIMNQLVQSKKKLVLKIESSPSIAHLIHKS